MSEHCFGLVVLSTFPRAGCYSDQKLVANGLQPEHQRAKAADEPIDYLVALLHREDSTKKIVVAARNLPKPGVRSTRALPDLKKVANENPDAAVKLDVQAAAPVIEAAMKAAP